MPKKSKCKKLRGARRMREQGYTLVGIWLDKSELESCKKAAERQHKKLATYIRTAAVIDAELGNIGARGPADPESD